MRTAHSLKHSLVDFEDFHDVNDGRKKWEEKFDFFCFAGNRLKMMRLLTPAALYYYCKFDSILAGESIVCYQTAFASFHNCVHISHF